MSFPSFGPRLALTVLGCLIAGKVYSAVELVSWSGSLDFGGWYLEGSTFSRTAEACLSSSQGNEVTDYALTIGSASGMALVGELGNSLSFSLEIEEISPNRSFPPVRASDLGATLPHRFRSCEAGGPRLRFRVSVAAANVYALPPDSYSLELDLSAQSYHSKNNNLTGPATSFQLTASIEVPPLVRISGLQDVVFGIYDGAGDEERTLAFCVYTNAASFRITPSSSIGSLGGIFAVSDGANLIPYQVGIGRPGEAPQEVANGNESDPLDRASSYNGLDCVDADNAAVSVRMLESDLLRAPAGSYSGTLVLRVEPF